MTGACQSSRHSHTGTMNFSFTKHLERVRPRFTVRGVSCCVSRHAGAHLPALDVARVHHHVGPAVQGAEMDEAKYIKFLAAERIKSGSCACIAAVAVGPWRCSCLLRRAFVARRRAARRAVVRDVCAAR
jgi:hypothetical protein